ncbi:RIP metalloprotease RseP [Marinilongibacter aquaticus]|uniref:RIP metalloprotease RseP n=1 Tax=Marinilongibacter aquaticus TaxID=2975157 RepID=UPI0021BDCA79|nr:RIP metalloprotease RseP [Marinilongibacter aquaticus]UBM57698.1 RIP metalloprotease RseP [Marinilongibacter aquaticus]
MEVLVMVGQLLLGLTILVGLHEWGHFIAARIFGIRVNKFYIFFDFLFPLPNVLNFALWKKKKGDTEYGLGWFPMGGYVDIEGMIDETKDSSKLAAEPQPYEFRAKPAWQRLIVMLGGIIVNIVLGVLIFWALTFKAGENYISMKEVNKLGIVAYPVAQEIGLKTGDKIVNVSGKPIDRFADLRGSDVILGENVYFTVDRNGKTLEIPIPNDLIEKVSDEDSEGFIEPIETFSVGEVVPDLPAAKAGIETEDRILAFNGKPVHYYHEYKEMADAHTGEKVNLTVLRGSDTLAISPTLTEDGKLGFQAMPDMKMEHIDLGLAQSFGIGAGRAFSVISDNIRGFKKIFSGQVAAGKALAGPVGIARKFYGGVWLWTRFFMITGMLSMALAFINLLPIPALDGGHAVILLYEMISGRKPSEKFMERTQQIGMVILLSLMAWVLFNDAVQALF